MKKSKKSLICLSSLALLSSIVTPVISVETNLKNISSTNNSNENLINDSCDQTNNDSGVSPTTDENENTQSGYISNEILKNAIVDTSNFKTVSLLSGDYNYNYKNFEQSNDFESYYGWVNGIKKDLYSFGYLLWYNCKRFLSLNNMYINKLTFNNRVSERIYFHSDTVSFNFTLEVRTFNAGTINFSGTTIDLLPCRAYSLNFSVENAKLLPVVTKKEDIKNFDQDTRSMSGTGIGRNYNLAWKIENVNLSYGDKNTIINEFVPSFGMYYSQAFPYNFENLTNKKSYIDLYNENQSDISNINQDQLEYNISTEMDSQVDSIFNFIDSGVSVLEGLSKNLTLKELILKITPNILNSLGSLNVVPQFIVDILNLCLKSDSIKWMNFVNFIDVKRNEIVQMLEQKYPEYKGLIEPILKCIKPNLTTSSYEYKQLNFFISQLPDFVKNIFNNDILGLNNNPKPLVEILINNFNSILKLIPEQVFSQNKIIKSAKEIIELILEKTINSNYNLQIWNILKFDNQTTTKFINAILEISTISPQISNTLTILVKENNKFSINNLQEFITMMYSFMNTMFSKNENYTDISNRYNNLTIKKYYVLSPYLNKSTQQISFEYRYDITLKKNAKLELGNIRNWVSADAILKIINFSDIAIKLIPDFAKQTIKNKIFDIVPSTISLGEGENLTSIIFKSYKQDVLFKPVKNGSYYNFGYQFNYETKIFIQDPKMVQNIVKNYNNTYDRINLVVGSADIYYGELWNSVIQNVLLREYKYTSRFLASDTNKAVATIYDFDEDIIIPGFTVTKNQSSYSNSEIANLYNPTTNRETKTSWIDTNNNNFSWKNTTSKIVGYNPTITDELTSKIINNRYRVVEDKENYFYKNNPKIRPQFVIDPIVNFDFYIKIKANAVWIPFGFKFDVRIMYLKTHIFLPFKYINKNTNTLTDYVCEDISYLNLVQTNL